MSDEQIQAKIAALASQINQAKQRQQQIALAANTTHHVCPSRPSCHARGAAHWTPYGRGGRAGHRAGFQNRTLVLAGKTGNPMADGAREDSSSDTSAFISNRRAGTNSIMTKDTFERQQKQKAENQEATPRPQRQDHKVTPKDNGKLARTLVIENIKFEINHDGSKLLRVPDLSTAALETPKRWTQGPVTFRRSKHGNLIKATVATVQSTQRYRQEHGTHQAGHNSSLTFSRPTPKKQCEKFTRYGTYSNHHICTGHVTAKTLRSPARAKHTGKASLSPLTPRIGTCPRGISCRDAHDPAKVAYCKELLQHGTCSSEHTCDMSHDKTYHRVPACTFFLRGNCTNNACRYVHVDVHPSPTRVCDRFARLGFCAKGTDCDKRHVFECPAYAEKRYCADHEKGTCQLPHMEHAGALRKAARRQAKMASDDASDLSSDDEENNAETDDDEYDSDIIMGSDDDSHELIQQQDYVPFV